MSIFLAALGGLAAVVLLMALWAMWATRRLFRAINLTGLHSRAPAPTPLNLPAGVVVVIGAVLGALAGFVHTFGFAAPWAKYLAVILVFTGALGISPLVGTAFRNAIHLSANVSLIITAGLTALVFAIPTFGLNATWTGILQGIVVFAATLGFGPVPVPPSKKFGWF